MLTRRHSPTTLGILLVVQTLHCAEASAQQETTVRTTQTNSSPYANPATRNVVAAQQRKELARIQFQLGVKEMDAAQWAKAAQYLEVSISWYDSVNAEYQLAQCYREMGRLATTLEKLTNAERLARAEGLSNIADDIKEEHAKLKPSVPSIVVRVAPKDAALRSLEISLDGNVVPRDRWNRDLIYVNAGEHFVLATVKNEPQFRWPFRITEKGETVTINVELPAQRTPPQERSAEESSNGLKIALIGGALLGAGVGVGLYLDLRAEDQRKNEPPTNAFAYGFLGGGSAMLALALAYDWLSQDKPPKQASTAQLVPTFDKTGAKLDLRLSF